MARAVVRHIKARTSNREIRIEPRVPWKYKNPVYNEDAHL